MSCHSRVELTLWQVCFLLSLCVLCVITALLGWFRPLHADNDGYPAPKNLNRFNNVTANVRVRPSSLNYLDEIGSPPKLNDPQSYVQWTILQMNDVYELIPLGGGKKGGLARVASIRQLLLQENPNTITVLSGDVVSPSALGEEGHLLYIRYSRWLSIC